jgi:hypothetical protein
MVFIFGLVMAVIVTDRPAVAAEICDLRQLVGAAGGDRR